MSKSDKHPKDKAERDVLSSLPRRRPQRVTARREATRNAPSAGESTDQSPARRAQTASRRKVAPAAPQPPAPVQPVPRQGFACDEPRVGVSIDPPNGTEMVLAALEFGGSLAQSGISTGGRLLKSAWQRLARS